MVLYADDTSIIFFFLITDPNKISYKTNLNQTFKDINTWFKVTLLKLNFNKTQYMEFRTTKRYDTETYISFFFFIWTETIGTAATPGLFCQPQVIMRMILSSLV
jgi:hypothetical protein